MFLLMIKISVPLITEWDILLNTSMTTVKKYVPVIKTYKYLQTPSEKKKKKC